MEAIKEQLRKPLVLGIAALIVGFLLGVVYGWVIDPVQWTDAAVDHLRADLQEEYLRMAIDSYSMNTDPLLARKRFEEMGAGGAAVLSSIVQNPGTQNPQIILAYQATVLGGTSAELITPLPQEQAVAEAEAEEEDGGFLGILLPILCVAVLVAAGVVFYIFYVRPRQAGSDGRGAPLAPSRTAAPEGGWTDYSAAGQEPPMVQFMSSYKIGDDLFDESFSIDSPAGEFLGECGVGISETVGVGEPKKVSSFEVWLFDKNDIQTVTKVLMSAHAFLDESSRQRLAAKGEPLLAEPGTETVLETQTLRLAARVIDMGYGEGAQPDHSFFEHMILELSVWSKAQ